MYFDVIYDEITGEVIEIIPFGDKIDKYNTSDIFNPTYEARLKEITPNYNLVAWCKDLPKDSIKNYKNYKVEFEDKYSKPIALVHKDGTKYSLNLQTKIKDNKIIWFGSFLDYVSYSNITRDLSFNLKNKGYNIKFYSTQPSGAIEIDKNDMATYQENACTVEETFSDDCLKILSYIPVSKIPHAAYTILYTMVETFDSSQQVIDCMRSYCNEIWVPTEYAKNQWRNKINERINIEVMPLWFDEKKFYPNVEKYDCSFIPLSDKTIPEKPSNYKFLFVSRYSHRKGIDALLKAYIEEFDFNKDDVSLVLFCRHIVNIPQFKEKVINDIKKIIKSHNKSIPPIYLHQDVVPEDKQGNMYGWGDCHVLPTRGEGFGLTAIESAACKIPQILPNHTGLSDFVNENTAYIIDTDDVISCGKIEKDFNTQKPKYVGDHPEWTEYITPYYNDAKFALMGDKAVNQIRKHMRNIYENKYIDINQKIENFYNLIHEKYTLNKCLKKIQDRIDFILKNN